LMEGGGYLLHWLSRGGRGRALSVSRGVCTGCGVVRAVYGAEWDGIRMV